MITLNQSIEAYNAEYLPAKDGDACYIKLSGVSGFDVEKTFDCGQCFRFDPVKETEHNVEYAGVAGGRFFSVAQDSDTIYLYNCTPEFFSGFLCKYLALDVNYDEIRSDILAGGGGEYMLRAAMRGEGIRILRQEPWEALCSFIISQNNNIPRIKKLIRALSEKCGKPIPYFERVGMEKHGATSGEYAFPLAESVFRLGDPELKNLKVGFRASYISDAAQKVFSGELDFGKVAMLCTNDCIESLMTVKGVGLKVASCTALFGMQKYDAFPIDVWIRRVLSEHFEKDFNPESLGKYAGIAQQYMFYFARFDK